MFQLNMEIESLHLLLRSQKKGLPEKYKKLAFIEYSNIDLCFQEYWLEEIPIRKKWRR